MKLFLDDLRDPPDDSWTIARNYEECIAILTNNEWWHVSIISLDHDLGEKKTGYDVLLWIEEQVALHGYKPPCIRIHTANPVGRRKMDAAAQSIMRLAQKNDF